MKKVLVYGLGLTGISAAKTLDKMGYDVYTFDKNKKEVKELKGYKYSPISDDEICDFDFEFVVKSPGIPPRDEVVEKLSEKYEIISDIELSFRLFPQAKIIATTGTNGKTSTTSMISHILNESGIKAISVGNIGEGILWQMYENPDAVFSCELSSFQLHDVATYKPHIASITNITEDHFDWHGSFDDYINSKLNISKRQDERDFLVINHDDPILQDHKADFKAKVYEFSSQEEVNRGAYLKGSSIFFKDEGKNLKLMDVDDLSIIGRHNYENLMVAILACYLYGLSLDDIVKASKSFKSIEHRLEFVGDVRGVKVFNDSKGTNVDSSIKAIQSFDKPMVIIAGGYDKNIDYSPYVKEFKNHGKLMVIIGQTTDKLVRLCEEYKVNYKKAKDMEEAVKISFENLEEGDIFLLSPASASWGMYRNFEERGRDFKEKIEKYKG
ncbi:UDP-N-acetylmuramoyl-L-alanine--D-glutamate ligase [uncultured Anaerococcus sp.]|uniref:UDP-N-acetylmuramoyl-L-alanine--D-glutamate ligase n=1 Tax=uncultured Anaerococcus sp. TaxID=293428 RepID=UPI00280418E0|nr:UDP-N-acetylmuramoyl-L-alanine--D-glutamate ligase [uncultured Anaerococcus sp.]